MQRLGRLALALSASGALHWAAAQPVANPAEPRALDRGVSEWLMRMHEASRRRAYTGTFVVSSATGSLTSARIWHVCEGDQQVERVEALSGAPRSTFRRNDQVITFIPQAKLARTERRESLGLFPELLASADSSIPEFYQARQIGNDRVAGFDADVVELRPRDALRYGYRVWSEKKSGLVVKLQTLDADSRVLEQAAFSELQLDVPVRADQITRMMANTEGYRIERDEPVKTTALTEGWLLRTAVAGFKPIGCYRRPAAERSANTLQWIFSDGLASVSLFVEPFEAKRHTQEGTLAMGATQTLTRRLQAWWLTAVGEVPSQTLQLFAQGLERKKP